MAMNGAGRRAAKPLLSGRLAAARRSIALLLIVLGVIGVGLGSAPAMAQQPGEVVIAEIDGAINGVTARFLARVLEKAEENDAGVVIVTLETPGGALNATRDMVEDILASPVPVVVYVWPDGAQAASAGTFIVAAAGVAAMAPTTNIGAASVVLAGGEDLPETLQRKATEDAAALLRGIAERRDRNADALERTVREATAYTASEALELNVIDLIATDMNDLLRQIDGRVIPAADTEVEVRTEGASVRHVGLNFVEQVLAFLAIPDVAFLLLTLGGIGLIVELWNFGTFIPGILGIIFLTLAFVGLGQLPFSWAGIGLIVLALILFFLEAQAPGVGFFGIAGAIVLVLGGFLLIGFFGPPAIPGGAPGFRVSWWTLGGVGVAAAALLVWLGREVRLAGRPGGYHSPVESEELEGKTARVTRSLSPEGEVTLVGEIWMARLPRGQSAPEGAEVRVKRVDGFVLEVEPVQGDATPQA